MFEFILAVFKIYPFTKWATVVGFCLLFFGGRDWGAFGFWILGIVGAFCIVLWILIDEHEEWLRKKRRE